MAEEKKTWEELFEEAHGRPPGISRSGALEEVMRFLSYINYEIAYCGEGPEKSSLPSPAAYLATLPAYNTYGTFAILYNIYFRTLTGLEVEVPSLLERLLTGDPVPDSVILRLMAVNGELPHNQGGDPLFLSYMRGVSALRVEGHRDPLALQLAGTIILLMVATSTRMGHSLQEETTRLGLLLSELLLAWRENP